MLSLKKKHRAKKAVLCVLDIDSGIARCETTKIVTEIEPSFYLQLISSIEGLNSGK